MIRLPGQLPNLADHNRLNRELATLAHKHARRIEAMARKLIGSGSPKTAGGFSAAMGGVCFYDRDRQPVDDDDLPKPARRLVAYVYEYQNALGSPGIHLLGIDKS